VKRDNPEYEVVDDETPPPSKEKKSKKSGPKKRKTTAKKSSPLKWLVIGGAVLAFPLAVAAVFFLIRALEPAGQTGGENGSYAVIDELPDAPAAGDDAPVKAEAEMPKGTSRLLWAGKPDPALDAIDYSNAFGAATPEQLVLPASQGGPYLMGVPINPANRFKNVKTEDKANPWKTVSLAGAPFPVVDVRTGKEVGVFPAECALKPRFRLSSNGEYLTGTVSEVDESTKAKLTRDYLVVWKRGADKPILRWLLPARVPWADFVAPDRIALYHNGPKPQFVVFDVNKTEPIVSVPLPDADFPPTNDLKSPNNPASYYDVQLPNGAVSPGGNYVSLPGKSAIVVIATADGRAVGRLGTGPVASLKDYSALGFDETGAELRAIYNSGKGTILRSWAMADGQLRHSGPYLGDKVYGPALVSGPEPGTLLVGLKVIDVASGKPITELHGVQRWVGKDRYLASVYPQTAVNAKALADSYDFQINSGLFLTAFKNEDYLAKAAPFVAAREKSPTVRPPTTSCDRTGIVVTHYQPGVEWSVKPSAAPALPAGFTVPVWPTGFGATEAAVFSNGRTWVRYDLATGNTIGVPIPLWADTVAEVGGEAGRLVSLSRDGQQLAVVDPSDRPRVDVWDASGKRLLGLRPYADEPITWSAWSADGKLLTACTDSITGWNVANGKAVFEIEGVYKNWALAPGGAWVMATSQAGNIDFFDSASGKFLGHIPGLAPSSAISLAPDGKTLVRVVSPGPGVSNGIQVWDLSTGKRSPAPEVPIGNVLGYWVGPRHSLAHIPPAGNTPDRFLLYDLDAHTHTYWYDIVPGLDIRNDSFGRAWSGRTVVTGRRPNKSPTTWRPLQILGAERFASELAFSPGSTIRVEVNVGHRTYNQQIAKQMAEELQKRGCKIGRGGWVLRADYTIGQGSQKFNNPLNGKETISVTALNITWKLLTPDGTEAWQAADGGSFDPFRSKYVKVGSRTGTFSPNGGGYQQVQLDFDGKDPQFAQIEEILEQQILHRKGLPVGLPACIAKTANGYESLPIKEKLESEKKP
jgi:hypothetical protein